MSSVRKKTTYFNEPGEHNTDTVLAVVGEYVQSEEIHDIVVASTTGRTGAKATKALQGRNVVVVTHCYGFKEPGETEMLEEHRKEILADGGKIVTGVHALSSAERAVRKEFGSIQPLELIASVLRRMGEGSKVCVEICLMAADAGMIPVDKDVVAIGGTGKGADTALRMRAANAARFFDLKIREIIAKPMEF